jgi:hypothetical protein
MSKWIMAAGAAALAISMPTLAAQGQGKGNDNKGGGQSAKAERGGGPHARGGNESRGQARQAAERGDRGNERAASARVVQDDRGRGNRDVRVERGNDRGPVRVKDNGNRGNGNGRAAVAVAAPVGVDIVRRNFDSPFFRQGRSNFDCPPGLDRKDNGCLPPGQAMKLVGAPLNTAFRDDLIPYSYRNWYRDNDRYFYRMGDGYIYRIDRGDNLVSGLIPLFGAGYYAMGDPWPQPYNFYNVPYQYRSYWADSNDQYYRYGDGAIYRVDPSTNAVSAIVALLAGDLGVGSRLPVGYDTYNVPMAYRAQYYDTPNDWYRYNDGYIYRVDPTTRLITAVIDAIV